MRGDFAEIPSSVRSSIAGTQVAIIGAGPYGLSIAAHLRARGVQFRIFGSPMQTWRTRMPSRMLLKSEGFASNLYDPEGRFTLEEFCARERLVYGDVGIPVPLETLAAYGLFFQAHLVPELENRVVVQLDRTAEGFLLRLDNGEALIASHAVVAVGTTYFPYVPPALADLPSEFVSHSSEHHDLSRFRRQNVTVIGGGSSALDLAALLHEVGADVRLVARQPSLVFHAMHGSRSLWRKVRYPMSGIGPGWKSRLLCDATGLFRYLTPAFRVRTVRTYLGPAAAGFMKDRIVGRLPLLLGSAPRSAEIRRDLVRLQLINRDAVSSVLSTNHVIAATGYKIDVRRLPFLSEGICSRLQLLENAPVLSRNFQSSIPGLYFVGLASAYEFGPVMRFMFGAGYTARRLSAHLARSARYPHT